MDDLKLTFHWITTNCAGYLKQLHVKTASALVTSMHNNIYVNKDDYAIVQHICNLLKTTILASYPKAQTENWHTGEKDNGEVLPESYRNIIPALKNLFDGFNPEQEFDNSATKDGQNHS